jgi:Ser/Thr protein kinase RdoA (MazF antagonist)
MSPANLHPYDCLTPDVVLDAVESLGGACDGRLLALNSYENRVYRVGIEAQPAVVVKFYRPARWTDAAILEEHAFTRELQLAEVPVVAPMVVNETSLHAHAGFRFAVFPLRGGRAPELDDGDVRETIGRFLGRIHMHGAKTTFKARPAVTIDTYGAEPIMRVGASNVIPTDIAATWHGVATQALEEVRRAFDRAGDVRQIRLHADCHIGNILYTDDGPHFVDFDDCRSGPAIHDLWMLLSGSRDDMQQQLRAVLDGYTDFADFNPRELHLVEALRTLRMLHFSDWLTTRRDDPAFLLAFPWFFGNDAQRYWQNQILQLREQIAAMQEAPLQLFP